jgi:Hemerythrin HHE cation binding domain
LGYCKAFLRNIHEHHDHEDKVIFPLIRDKCPEVEELDKDHKKLIPLLQELEDYCNSVLKDLSKWNAEYFLGIFKELQDLLLPHFAVEEDNSTPEILDQKFETAYIIKMHGDVIKAAQKDAVPFTTFAFLYTHCNPKEREAFFGYIPKAVRKTLFPLFIRRHKGYWKYSTTEGGLRVINES